MAEILYVGPRSPLAAAASALVREAGHEFAIVGSRDALRRIRRSACGAVVLCWRPGQATPALARTAKERGLAVIVITRRLVDAFRAFDALADIFLERPASPHEVATLAIELIRRNELAASQPHAVAVAS